MIGDKAYWTTGISLLWSARANTRNGVQSSGWSARLEFFDGGFCSDDTDAGSISTEGVLRTRYGVSDGSTKSGLSAAIDTLIADARRLGIQLGSPASGPSLYYEGDGEDRDYPPPTGWRDTLIAEAARIGWHSPYGTDD